MDSDNLVSINAQANKSFLDGDVVKVTEKVQSQNGDEEVSHSVVNGHYSFTWGQVVEQIAGNFYIWGFRFSALTNKSDGELYEIYKKIFKHLHKRHPQHSSEHAILVAGIHDWCIYPGNGKDAIIIAAPFQAEYTSRIWVNGKILTEEIPDIITRFIQ